MMAKKASKKPKPRLKKARRAKKVSQRMSDKPRPWPNHAAEDRDKSAEDAQDILGDAAKASERTNDVEVLRALNRIMKLASNIIRRMEKHGAKTRPQ